MLMKFENQLNTLIQKKIKKKYLTGWTEWTIFHETKQVRYRKCNDTVFGNFKGQLQRDRDGEPESQRDRVTE
jgi:hypothetical protein